jgi:hypothetical protein
MIGAISIATEKVNSYFLIARKSSEFGALSLGQRRPGFGSAGLALSDSYLPLAQ